MTVTSLCVLSFNFMTTASPPEYNAIEVSVTLQQTNERKKIHQRPTFFSNIVPCRFGNPVRRTPTTYYLEN
jgi:hypothetical protein